MTRIKTTTVLVFLFLIFIPIATAQSTPPSLPAAFYGLLTINDQPSPTGVVVVAKINNEDRGSITTTQTGNYGGPNGLDPKIIITGSDEDEGDTILFFINGGEADQSAIFHSGDVSRLDLSVQGLVIVQTTTTIAPASSGSSGSGGGSSGGSSQLDVVHNLGDISTGVASILNTGDTALFLIDNRQHTTKVNFIGNDFIEAIISSSPIATKISIGEAKQFDVDDDQVNDFELTLTNIISRKAYLTFKSLKYQPISQEPSNEESIPEETGLEGITGEAVRETGSNKALGWGIIIAIVAIGLGIVGYFASRKKQ